MATVTFGPNGGDMSASFIITYPYPPPVGTPSATQFAFSQNGSTVIFRGSGFGNYRPVSYLVLTQLTVPDSGLVSSITLEQGGGRSVTISGLSIPVKGIVGNGNSLDLSLTTSPALDGDDLLTGSPGNDVFAARFGNDTIVGGAGNDTASFNHIASIVLDSQGRFPSGVHVSLELQGQAQDTGAGVVTMTGIENLSGSGAGDILTGDGGDNVLSGDDGDDQLFGGDGNDTLTGGRGTTGSFSAAGSPGNLLDGGPGIDTAVFNTDFDATYYAIRRNFDGSFVMRSTFQTDVFKNVEFLVFNGLYGSNQKIPFVPNLQPVMEFGLLNILRSTLDGPYLAQAVDISSKVMAGTMTVRQEVMEVIKMAAGTTSVATMSYQFFTGRTPSAAGLDYLLSASGPNPNNLNSAYYQSFSLENRYINFAVNLGAQGEGKDFFAARYGGLTLFEATKLAYTDIFGPTIFGPTPTDAKVHALIDTRIDYFAAYGRDGPNGLGTKAAMVGWLLAESQKAGPTSYELIGSNGQGNNYAHANDRYLVKLAGGLDLYGVDMLGPL